LASAVFPLYKVEIHSYKGDMETSKTNSTSGNSAHTKESAMLVKFSTLAGGAFIEDTGADERKPCDRCFRFDSQGNAEYTFFADLVGRDPSPRWFGHAFKESEFLVA
jgi:hypothetical protein